jgi:hypothetical protein
MKVAIVLLLCVAAFLPSHAADEDCEDCLSFVGTLFQAV